ncbi:hypothetical protein [Nocardia sp. NPDC127526]|uniref:hypothetical protein n=1 Tax=Nocardia sp. NPDC127526 TaxID=3345393 RepID=UPI00363798C5
MGLFRHRATDPTQAAICGCGHHLALHDRVEHSCAHLEVIYNDTEDVVRNRHGHPVLDDYGDIQITRNRLYASTVACGCRQYVGPEVVNLLSPSPVLIPRI